MGKIQILQSNEYDYWRKENPILGSQDAQILFWPNTSSRWMTQCRLTGICKATTGSVYIVLGGAHLNCIIVITNRKMYAGSSHMLHYEECQRQQFTWNFPALLSLGGKIHTYVRTYIHTYIHKENLPFFHPGKGSLTLQCWKLKQQADG